MVEQLKKEREAHRVEVVEQLKKEREAHRTEVQGSARAAGAQEVKGPIWAHPTMLKGPIWAHPTMLKGPIYMQGFKICTSHGRNWSHFHRAEVARALQGSARAARTQEVRLHSYIYVHSYICALVYIRVYMCALVYICRARRARRARRRFVRGPI